MGMVNDDYDEFAIVAMRAGREFKAGEVFEIHGEDCDTRWVGVDSGAVLDQAAMNRAIANGTCAWNDHDDGGA